MNNMEVPHVRTGYESVMGVRASDKFVVSATEDGEVLSVSISKITVSYKELGRKKYSLKEWTSKEEAGITYTHKLTTNLKKGDKFNKDDTLVYDNSFFEPDLFDPKRVVYRSGASLTVALMEAPETYEDSGAISRKASKTMGTVVTKVKSITIANTDTVVDPVQIGAKLEPSSVLLSIAGEELERVSSLDEKAREILSGFKLLSPKSKYRGTVTKILVFYNCDFEELTESLQLLATQSDKYLLDSVGYTGKVDSGFSIEGVPLPAGGVVIKYYISVDTLMGTGDKAILANQLKFTVGEVYDNEIVTESGDVVDGVFSAVSISARVVNSAELIGTTSKLLEVLSDKAVDAYFD